jgi:HSP20 family protein
MFDLIPFRKRNEDLVSRMFKSFYDVFNQNDLLDDKLNTFKTDITETKDAYLLEAELPGFDKEDITIDIYNNQLTIRAKKDEIEETRDKDDKVIRKERYYGELVRQFYVDNIIEDEIQAKLDKGVLKIKIPKKQKDENVGRKIEIQ